MKGSKCALLSNEAPGVKDSDTIEGKDGDCRVKIDSGIWKISLLSYILLCAIFLIMQGLLFCGIIYFCPLKLILPGQQYMINAVDMIKTLKQ